MYFLRFFLSPIAYLVDQVHFIGSPLVDTDYATPGGGNVSSDGVHPSTQGCKCFDCVWTVFVFISCIYVTISMLVLLLNTFFIFNLFQIFGGPSILENM